jgi:hypothetical protein
MSARPAIRRAALHTVVAALVVLAAAGDARAQIYTQSFDGPDGSPWPAPWLAVTPHVTLQDLSGNRGRLNGDPQHVARMVLPGFAEADVEVEVTVEFEDVAFQGFGLYVRQNGGYLQDTVPFGQGYATFLKGNWAWPEDLGLWTETNGVETQYLFGLNPIPGGLQNGVPYRVRFRVEQDNPTQTLVQAKVWEVGDPEPVAWTIESLNAEAVLQNTAGTFAIDLYNHSGTGHLFVDDLVIHRLPPGTSAPVAAAGAQPLTVHPNPMTTSCRVSFAPDAHGPITMRVYDVSGRLRATRPAAPGAGSLTWTGADDAGSPLPGGVYFLRVESAAAAASPARRVVLRR